jgi:hypothetical protein
MRPLASADDDVRFAILLPESCRSASGQRSSVARAGTRGRLGSKY